MHLQLMLSGVNLSYPTNRHLIAQTAIMLQNIVHHHIIYPVLTGWGYQPSITECKGIAKQLSILEKNPTNHDRARTDPELEALMAIVYARGQLDCGAPDIMSRLDNIFSAGALLNARRLGNQVTSVIQKQTDPSPNACREILGECLGILRLSNMITISSIHT